MTPIVTLMLVLVVGLLMLAAFFAGAWVQHRAATRQSPVPHIPALSGRDEPEDKQEPPTPPRRHKL